MGDDDWGFWAHRRINRLAVFTLPAEMAVFFKEHIEFITAHAVDPDKRRYASPFEGPRHFIDIDHWGTYPFPDLPRDWTGALARYTEVYLLLAPGDSILLFGDEVVGWGDDRLTYRGTDPRAAAIWEGVELSPQAYRLFFRTHWEPQYYEERWVLDCAPLESLFGKPLACAGAVAFDRFSEYGISPYNLIQIQGRLTRAMRARDTRAILRLATEMGHYIGDAHVPLHNTTNYNGQLTDQVGIHAFWESRIPELFADEEYDYFVGPATYISDPAEYYWNVVLTSYQMVDTVLQYEKELRASYPKDRQTCFEERLGQTIRIECKDFARAYQAKLNGMVERRMRTTIQAIGSAWYTAWIDAGQPDLSGLIPGPSAPDDVEAEKLLNEAFQSGKIIGRKHDSGNQ